MQQSAKLVAMLIGILFLSCGMIPTYLAVTMGLHSYHMVQTGIEADGVIDAYQLVGLSSKQRYWPVVHFKTEAGQVVSFVEMNDNLSKGSYRVLYKAENPQNAVVNDFKTLWKWPLISVCAAALLLFAGGTVLFRAITRL
jgi:DMSO reductase anchor subunit